MTPDLSEFSYGFALTNELVAALGSLNAAPVFPSLIEEGREGGGYDVNLDAPGLPLYLQFKRSDCMVRNTARECAELKLTPPFYRMYITERSRSQQHDLLLSLDRDPNVVFYAAPRFHTIAELNSAFMSGAVRPRSFFIRPREIGPLDHAKHHVVFTDSQHWVCSEPREVNAVRGEDLEVELREALSGRQKTLREGGLDEMLESARRAIVEPIRQSQGPLYASTVQDEDSLTDLTDRVIGAALHPADEGVIAKIAGREKSSEEAKLRALADIAMKVFSSQLFVVQNSESPAG